MYSLTVEIWIAKNNAFYFKLRIFLWFFILKSHLKLRLSSLTLWPFALFLPPSQSLLWLNAAPQVSSELWSLIVVVYASLQVLSHSSLPSNYLFILEYLVQVWTLHKFLHSSCLLPPTQLPPCFCCPSTLSVAFGTSMTPSYILVIKSRGHVFSFCVSPRTGTPRTCVELRWLGRHACPDEADSWPPRIPGPSWPSLTVLLTHPVPTC